ncbi:histidine kinase [Cellulomonas sp. SLBN-39]|uniref:sensor histidine kinase n=1 Tax=Cellulomonas sp. SLBN-39 TaxID=2768446 RepID=UPI0011504930|nr:histidine kinase [Cellulomonas sp. SLBN-39]TQL02828.1 signal transduction histidine kinase [Cellulomonas sp. SLBN-39]
MATTTTHAPGAAPATGSDDPPSAPTVLRADAAVVAPALVSARHLRRAPVDPASGRALAQVVLGWMWLLAGGLVALCWTVTAAGLVVVGVGIPMLVVGLVVGSWCASAERARLAAQTGAVVDAPAYRRAPRRGWWRWSTWWSVLADGRRWAHQAYALLATVVSTAGFVVVVAVGGAGLAAVAFPVYGARSSLAGLGGVGAPVLAGAAVVAGILLVWCAALAAQGTSLLLVVLARALLGPGPRDELRRARAATHAAQDEAVHARARADELQATRSAAVAAADAERRRIERDLHDGAQQRLVALGVELGAARRRASRDPDAAAGALEHAHAEVKETLAELRDLVRGIHPAVLTDRGLDAALSALAARSPVPVRVVVPDPGALARATPAAQAAAYFVVAEALTNVAKHAAADRVVVEAGLVEHDGPCRLRVAVADDGTGGADAAPGGGLDGLRSRVAALDGTFDLDSPAGRGTRLTVEVPCAS